MANQRLQTIPAGSGTPTPIDSENETLDFLSVRIGADKLELGQTGSGVSAKLTTNGTPLVVPAGSAPDEPATIQQLTDTVDSAVASFTASQGVQRVGNDFRLIDLGVQTGKIANDAIDKDKINPDVAGYGLDQNVDGSLEVVAGNGITLSGDTVAVKSDETGGTNLAKAVDVNTNGVAIRVDDSSLEGNPTNGRLRVKALGIQTSHLADLAVETAKIGNLQVTEGKIAALAVTAGKIGTEAVTKEKINDDVAGAGLRRDIGGALEISTGFGVEVDTDLLRVKPDTTGGANLASAIDVNVNGVAVKVDDSTIEEGLTGQLRVKAAGITVNELANDSVTKEKVNEDVAGAGLVQALDGSLEVNAGDGIDVSSDQVKVKPRAAGVANVSAAVDVSTDGVGVKTDDTTIGVNLSNQLKVVDGSIGTTQLTDDGVTKEKINSDVAGAGLGQDVDGALEVLAGSGIEISADTVAAKRREAAAANIAHAIDVSSEGIGVRVDDTSITVDAGTGRLKVVTGGISASEIADDAITKEKINPDVAGNGLGQNGDGSLEVNVDDVGIEIDTDTLRLKDLGVVTDKLADDAVTKEKVNADVAGNGLGQNVDGSLEVNVDGVGIEIDTDALRLKDLGVVTDKLNNLAVTTGKINDDAVTKEKVNADVAGAGLGQNVDGSLEVTPGNGVEIVTDAVAVKRDDTGGANLAKAIDVNANGVAVRVDDVTVEGDATTGQLKVKDSGISTAKIANDAVDKDKIAADVAGNGLGQNVDGSLEVNVDDVGIEIDTDALRLKDLGVVTAKINDDAVTKEKINADVAGAGIGQNVDGSLEVNPGAGIQVVSDEVAVKRRTANVANVAHAVDVDVTDGVGVRVDDSTIEGDATTGRLRVKSAGIGTTQLANDAVDKDKIAADVAGDGLGQNVDGSLEVNVGNGIELATDAVAVKRDSTGGANLAMAVDVNANGVAVRVDDSTIEGDGTTGRLRVKGLGIGEGQLAAKAVTTAKIDDGAVTALQLGTSAVETAKINNDAVTKDKISSDVAGAGLGQNVDGSLEVSPGNGLQITGDTVAAKRDDTGGANLAKAIDVNANGIAVRVDDSTIEGDGTTGRLRVKDLGITAGELATDAVETDKIKDSAVTADKISSAALGTGLSGGDGVPLALDFTQVVNYSDVDFVVGVGGQTEFDVSIYGIGTNSRIDFFRNGQLLVEGASDDYQRDAGNDKVVTNYTIPQGSKVKIRVYLGAAEFI